MISCYLSQCWFIISLWPSDTIWWYISGSILTAPSHYLSCLWLLNSEVLGHSLSVQDTNLYNEFENYTFEKTATSPKGQWVMIPQTIFNRHSIQIDWHFFIIELCVGNLSEHIPKYHCNAFNHCRLKMNLSGDDGVNPKIHTCAVLKIRTICHARDLWKLAQSCKQLHLLCLPDSSNLPGTALLSGYQSSQGALKSTEQDRT